MAGVAVHFVLDHNFPIQATGLPWPPAVEITSLSALDVRLTAGVEDWEIMLALYQRGDVDGFISNDERMLSSPREMVVLSRTKLTLVVTRRVGHHPLRATGLLMVGLEQIAKQIVSADPQIFRINPPNPTPVNPHEQVNKLAQREDIRPPDLISSELAAIGDLDAPILPGD